MLRDAGIAEDRRTAGVLLCHVLSIDGTGLLTRSSEEIEGASYMTYLKFIARRAAGEPLQYITGHQEFYGLDFIVTPDVLIPRPETEFLVERVIRLARDAHPSAGEADSLIVDVGTGSGCIAVAVAVNIPATRVIATDISAPAIDVARKNAARHNVSSRIEWVEGDLLRPLEGRGLENGIDVIACNPPYVPSSKPETVQREVREWEPHVALFGGGEGIDFYGRLFVEALVYLKPGGFLVCEIGYSQLEAVCKLIDPEAWVLVDVTNDLQGIPRTLAIRRKAKDPRP